MTRHVKNSALAHAYCQVKASIWKQCMDKKESTTCLLLHIKAKDVIFVCLHRWFYEFE